MNAKAWTCSVAALLVLMPACASGATEPRSASQPTEHLESETLVSQPDVALLPAQPSGTVHVAILDPLLLRDLESRGFALGMLVEKREAATTAELSRLPGHASIFDVLRKDFEEVRRQYPEALVSSVQGARLFDVGFLDSKEMSFALSGVFNRLDRRGFYGAGCGEIRFIYRLGYHKEQGGESMQARLPMTINVVFNVAGTDCRDVAAAWTAPAELGGEGLLSWMLSRGALSTKMRERWSLKAVETNLQTLRFQSTMHPKMAGHIEYMMRVFQPVANRPSSFAPSALENTPDLVALGRNKELRAELLAYLRTPEVLRSIDQGTLRLPEKFLARRALSVSPRSLARLANRPFKQLFAPEEFSNLDLSEHRSIASPLALLRRLDAASCMGCHQSRSIAGFHHLGDEPDPTVVFSALYRGSSPHLLGDLERRKVYVAALASHEAPSEFRPFPEQQGVAIGVGSPCGLGDPGFASWACPEGLHCSLMEDTEIGICRGDTGGVGDACQYGVIKSGRSPLQDRIEELTTYGCDLGQESCFKNVSAASQGMCVGGCGKVSAPESICGDFLDIDGFQRCLRHQGSYASCSASFVYPLALRACDETHACRSDYVCTRTRVGEPGACVPAYFVFQLRSDGYPLRK